MASENTTDLSRGIYRRQYSGYLRGRRINKISLEAEAWFWRVQAVVDDFGNTDADPEMLWLATVGKRKGVTVEQVEQWRDEMITVGLVSTYQTREDVYLHVEGFTTIQPCGRNGKRLQRCPPPDNSGLIQVNPETSGASDNDNHNEDDNQERSRSRQSKPRRKGSFDEANDQSPKFGIELIRVLPEDWLESTEAAMREKFPALAFTEIHGEWCDARTRDGSIGKFNCRRPTLVQYSADIEIFFRNWDRNRNKNGHNGAGHKPSRVDIGLAATRELLAECEK